jgi:hypothetical protein
MLRLHYSWIGRRFQQQSKSFGQRHEDPKSSKKEIFLFAIRIQAL